MVTAFFHRCRPHCHHCAGFPNTMVKNLLAIRHVLFDHADQDTPNNLLGLLFSPKGEFGLSSKMTRENSCASYDPEAWACWYVLAPYSKGLSHFSPVHSKGPDFIPRSRKGFLQVPMYPGTLRVSNDIQSFLWHQLRGGFRGQTMYLRPPSTSAGVAVSIVLVFNKIDGICPLQSQVEEDLSVCLTSNGGRICICQSTTVGSEAVLKRQPARVFAV